jgi:hypothetical protein
MSTLSRICLFSTFMIIMLTQLAIEPCNAQTRFESFGPDSQRMDAATEPTISAALEAASQREGLKSVLGREVRTRTDEDGGRVIDVLFDHSGNTQAAIIEFGGFFGIGTRKIAVGWRDLRFVIEGNRMVVIVNVTRDQLRLVPEYKPSGSTVVRWVSDK